MAITVEPDVITQQRWTQPVRLIAVPVKAVGLKTHRKQWMPRLTRRGLLPVVNRQKQLKGVLRQETILLGGSMPPLEFEYAEQLMSYPTMMLDSTHSVQDAIERFETTNVPLIPILNKKGQYTGECASYIQLYRLQNGLLRPNRVGGFATPFGVYLTSGPLSGGVGLPQLLATGVLFGLMIPLLDAVNILVFSVAAALWPAFNLMQDWEQLLVQSGVLLLSFFALMRFTPMSGLHAAEHMTVNAIELDLPIEEKNVALQAREHSRCGTNLMVLLGSVQLLGLMLVILHQQVTWWALVLYSAVWIFGTWKLWRPAGIWVQHHFTTKPPSPQQLASGVRAGQMLLARFIEHPHPIPSFWQKLWGSGLLQLMGTSLLTAWMMERLAQWDWRLFN